MLDAILVKENIVHLGALLYCVGFFCRDQILLRAFIIARDVVYVLYFFFAPDVPLWGGIFWSGVFTLVNVWMITRIVTDRTRFRMSTEERLLRFLDPLTPGEFRRLMKLARWHSAEAPTRLTEEHKPLDQLYLSSTAVSLSTRPASASRSRRDFYRRGGLRPRAAGVGHRDRCPGCALCDLGDWGPPAPPPRARARHRPRRGVQQGHGRQSCARVTEGWRLGLWGRGLVRNVFPLNP
jgi:hypothetical protein